MPQTTLTSYFVPILALSVISPTRTETQAQSATTVCQSTSKTTNLLSASIEAVDQKTARLPSVQKLIEPGVFGNTNLDFYVPANQPKAAIVKVLPTYIARLKQITSTLLPVKYPDKLFKECLEDELAATFSRVLLWDSQPVGWIRCRLEDGHQGCKQIYIQALGVLGPYRGCGLATNLLEQVTQSQLTRRYDLKSVYCHVWESNEDAMTWYEKRGFKRVVLIEQYYRRLKPAGAWIMRKELDP